MSSLLKLKRRHVKEQIVLNNACVILTIFLVSTNIGLAQSPARLPDKFAEPEKKLPLPGKLLLVADRQAFLILPKDYQPDRLTPWVWYAPTLPRLPGPEERWMFERFQAAGIAIAGIDVGESFGSPDGRKWYTEFYRELVDKHRLAEKPCLLARSRGGLMLYNWAVENPDKVSGIAGIYPVCNLTSYPGLQRACSAYGLTTEQLAEKLKLHNPIDRLTPLAEAKVPLFHLHGDQDQLVPLEENSGLLADRYRQSGGPITLKICAGQGHNMWRGWFESEELVEFVIQCLHANQSTE